jgi:hypothetical protein
MECVEAAVVGDVDDVAYYWEVTQKAFSIFLEVLPLQDHPWQDVA